MAEEFMELKNEMPLLYGHGSTCGVRASMEDEVLTLPRYHIEPKNAQITNPLSLFGVYDGHGGERCAKYVKKHLPEKLRKHLEAGDAVPDAFTKTYTELDAEFCSSGDTSGTTAVTFLLEHESGIVWVANVGDSRCVMCAVEDLSEPKSSHHLATPQENVELSCSSRSSQSTASQGLPNGGVDAKPNQRRSKSVGSVRKRLRQHFSRKGTRKDKTAKRQQKLEILAMTKDHRPDDPGEMKRIKAAGGYIWNRRVNGGLAITRAIGDADFKQADQQNLIICTPDITKHELTVLDRFVLLACDGLFDVLENDEVMEYVAKGKHKGLEKARAKSQTRRATRLKKKKDWRECLNKMCRELAEHAVSKGSSDNVSVVVVDIRPTK